MISEPKVALRRARPIHKEPHRIRILDDVTRGTRGGDTQGGHRDDPFPAQRQTFPTRRQHRHVGAPPRNRVDLASYRIQEMLTVVEHQQQPLRGQVLERRLLQAAPRDRLHPQARGQRVPHRAGIGHRRELTQPRTVGKLADNFRRHLQREPGLAHTAHAGQRHEGRLTHQLAQRRNLGLAPDEPRQLTRQVPRQDIERPQRRELHRQTRREHLEHPLRERQVPQTVLTQVHEFDRPVTHQAASHRRHHDLTAMRHAHQPRRTVHLTTEIVALAELRLTRVHTHPHPQRTHLPE